MGWGFGSSSGSQVSRPRNWPTRWLTEAQASERSRASSVSPVPPTTYALALIPRVLSVSRRLQPYTNATSGLHPGPPARSSRNLGFSGERASLVNGCSRVRDEPIGRLERWLGRCYAATNATRSRTQHAGHAAPERSQPEANVAGDTLELGDHCCCSIR